MYAAAEQQANVDYANSYHMHVDGPIQSSYPIFELLTLLPTRGIHIASSLQNQNFWMGRGAGTFGRGMDRATRVNVARSISYPKKGWYDVVVHGSRDGFHALINGQKISAYDFYKQMTLAGYKQGTRIRLISCHTGRADFGFAFQLSHFAKAKVVAPTIQTQILKNGKWAVKPGGFFRVFEY
jgi:hypothetical protein